LLGPERPSLSEPLATNSGHWEIETRLHYVRDFTYDEDRNRMPSKNLRRDPAGLERRHLYRPSRRPFSPLAAGTPSLRRPPRRRDAPDHMPAYANWHRRRAQQPKQLTAMPNSN